MILCLLDIHVLLELKMFSIKSTEELKNRVWNENREIIQINIPEETFPFDDLYKEIVTKNKTLIISSDFILYGFNEAADTTRKYSDVFYWDKNTDQDRIKNFWFIGENSVFDFWIMYINGKIHFLKHDYGDEKFEIDKIVDLEINFENWLRYAFLNREFEEVLEVFRSEDSDFKYYPENMVMEYIEKIKQMSNKLFETNNSYWNLP